MSFNVRKRFLETLFLFAVIITMIVVAIFFG